MAKHDPRGSFQPGKGWRVMIGGKRLWTSRDNKFALFLAEWLRLRFKQRQLAGKGLASEDLAHLERMKQCKGPFKIIDGRLYYRTPRRGYYSMFDPDHPDEQDPMAARQAAEDAAHQAEGVPLEERVPSLPVEETPAAEVPTPVEQPAPSQLETPAASLPQPASRPSPPIRPAPRTVAPKPAEVRSLFEGIEAYKESIERSAREERAKYALKSRVDCLRLEDCLLADFGLDAIGSVVAKWIGYAKQGKYSPVYARNEIAALRGLVDYLDAHNQIQWDAPKRWERGFLAARKSLALAAKKNATMGTDGNGAKVALTVDDLQALYRAATPRAKMLLLLGLNVGATQVDCATLKTSHIEAVGNKLYIHRNRNKTGVEGRFLLWPETVELLKAEIDKTPGRQPDEPILLSQQGKPLVWRAERGSCVDSVKLVWARLLQDCGLKASGRTYKYLRKFASQIIRNVADKDTADAWLCHAESAVTQAYNKFSTWEKVDAAIEAMRKQIDKMFR